MSDNGKKPDKSSHKLGADRHDPAKKPTKKSEKSTVSTRPQRTFEKIAGYASISWENTRTESERAGELQPVVVDIQPVTQDSPC